MPQTQIYEKERADYQRQTNQEDEEIHETHLIEKEMEGRQAQCFQWLQTQAYLNKGEMHENKEESKQTTENTGPIVIVNHMDSGHDITSMVEELLKLNDFSDNSSVFVIVPSVEHGLGNPSESETSTICIQMSSNPLKWKKKSYKKAQPAELDVDTVATAAQQGVKISAKGKKFFMEGLPMDVLSFNNKEILNGHQTLPPKKSTKNKLCQITTPERQVRRTEVQRCHVISTDTTIDRPCCCPAAKIPDYSEYRTNDNYVANLISDMSQSFIPGLSQSSAPSCPPSPCTHAHHTKPREIPQKQLCQCTPERFLAMLQQAVHEDRVQIMQSIGCGEGLKRLKPKASEPPIGLTPTALGQQTECHKCLYRSTRNKPTCTCIIHHTAGPLMACAPQTGDGNLIESIEMGKTEKKQPSNKQKRFYSTIGTSTGPKLDSTFKNEEKMKNVVCECSELEGGNCLVTTNVMDVCEVDNCKKMVTERVPVSKLYQRKQPPPKGVPNFHRDQSIRYYILMKPELIPNITGEQQAGDTTTVTEPSPSPAVDSALEAPSSSQNDDDDQGLNIKLDVQSPSSTEAGETASTDLPHESFDTW